MKNFSNKYKVRYSGGDIEPHEVFLDKLAHTKEEEMGISEKKLEVPIKEKMPYMLLGLFLLLAIVLLFKIFYLQTIEGEKLYLISKNNKGGVTLITPERGIIYDRNLKKLVLNSPALDLVCDRRQFLQSDSQTLNEIENIALALGREPEDIKTQIELAESSKVLISENISHDKLLVLEAKINEFTGCQIEKNTIRNYVLGAPLAHLLGYTGRINKEELDFSQNYAVNDYIGKTGLEKSYEDYLRGNPGEVELVKNVLEGGKAEIVVSEPESGKNLILNIDFELQQKIYEALEKSIKNVGSKKGAALALDPKTGAVLALVSYPSYDNNLFSKGISYEEYDKIQSDSSQPLFNRAVAAQYPTGSAIKPFTASAALQEKIISSEKKINDLGYISIRSRYDPSVVWIFRGIKPHGWVDMRQALAVSSNIYFYTIGGGYGDQPGLGPTRIKKYLELFGWGAKTGIDLPGELQGFIPSPEWKKQNIKESWWDGDSYNLSIGQSYLKVTPLQVASAYCAIANKGTLYKPQIVNRIVDASTSPSRVIKQFEPEVIRSNFIDEKNLQIVREGMRDVVTQPYGTAISLNSLAVHVAAKTGTAETSRDGYFNTWSASFAPYENPEIVLVAVIENVEGLRAPTTTVAREVLSWYFSK